MLRAVGGALCLLGTMASGASAHAIFPGRAVVQTMGERAFVQFHAVNARKDVTTFVVEIYEMDWTPSKLAVAWPKRLNVLPQRTDSENAEGSDQPFSVLLDLGGKPEHRVRVCTKSVPRPEQLRAGETIVNSRVCANVLVKRFQR